MSERTSITYSPLAPLRAQVGDSRRGGCAQISAAVTGPPESSCTLPLIVERGSSRTWTVASASTASTQVWPAPSRVARGGVTCRAYTSGGTASRAVPEALVSPQRSSRPASVTAQTPAPATGAPAGAVTMTATARTGGGVGDVGAGGRLWQAASATRAAESNERATARGAFNSPPACVRRPRL